MLISRVPEETGGEGRGEPDAAQEVARNFQTASELFELMTKDHDFEAGDDPLTTRDLVLLYKNIDLGKQLMSNVNEFKRQTPNQYVENVIYHDDPETDSDLSESYSNEDLHNIMLVNKERIDLLTNKPSLNSLCHKLGDLEIQVSNISTDYDRHFLFKDPYIKEQLKSLRLMSQANDLDTAMLPASLLDYICCKRLEDNYNFYMDNIIRYVKHTIEQLKRISNGDYLTDKVKEKWREVEQKRVNSENASKVLTSSISIPLQVERKLTGVTTAWDDIVHSEVDLRSLVKILEKKIVLEVPKMICGSYKLFSKYRADNLIISCKRGKQAAAEESRVDVVLQLQRSAAGQLVSNIESIMILHPNQQIAEKDYKEILPLTYEQTEEAPKVIELPEQDGSKPSVELSELNSFGSTTDYRCGDFDSKESSSGSATNRPGSPAAVAQLLRTPSRVIRAEAAASHVSPNELHFSMINLDRYTSLPEEGSAESLDYTKVRNKSPMKVRIKSPYENNSGVMEERKRRRLLEVRQRRERRKMAMDDNNKVSKHKPAPQATSSVTKLSITNKAFYNSIYGRNVNSDNGKRVASTPFNKIKGCKGMQKRDGVIQEVGQESEGDAAREETQPDDIVKKFNKSHFFDDAETEMSYMQSKQDKDLLRISTSTSTISNELGTNLCMQSDCCRSFTSICVKGQELPNSLEKLRPEHDLQLPKTQLASNKVPANSPKGDCKKVMPAVECRRSLEKIYTLMKKLREIESNEATPKQKTSVSNETRRLLSSESGTSLKHRSSYTNPSSGSFEKPVFSVELNEINKEGDESDRPSAIVPKVVICTKPQVGSKADETKKDRRIKVPRVRTIPENPLKAISQLLHEFDNVQKSRQKNADPKAINRSVSTDARNVARQEQQRRKPPAKDVPISKITAKVKTRLGREETKPEVPNAQILDKKRINDLIDEAREARGEAVRGPPKFSARLHALAQPRRAYVQALHDDCPRRQTPERALRTSRRGTDGHSSLVSVKPPHSPLERAAKPRRSAGSSPDAHYREPPQFTAVAAAANTLKKKMAAVESHGNFSVGRVAERVEPTRAPVLPIDLKLYSKVLSPTDDMSKSSIGSKLHRIVTMLRDEFDSPSSTADSEISLEKHTSLALIEESPQSSDQNVAHDDRALVRGRRAPLGSAAELEMLEHALHRRLSSGTFSGRLRIKKLTLTPKPSLQRVVMHQSGDTTSLILKSNLSQKMLSPKSSDEKTDLMSLLSATRLNCGLYGFPLQISTVGYTFSTFPGEMEKMTSRSVSYESCGKSDAATSYVVSEKRSPTTKVLQIEDGHETACQGSTRQPTECALQVGGSGCLAARPCSATTITEQVDVPKKNVETNTTVESVALLSSGKCDKEMASYVAEEKHELSEYTTSLDMLVGLLNEITKITTCAGEAVNAETLESRPAEPDFQPDDCVSLFVSNSNVSSRDEMEIIIPKTKSVSAEAMEYKPASEDKEVSALEPETPQRHADVSTGPSPGPEPSQQASHLPIDNGTHVCAIDVSTSHSSTSAVARFEYCDIGSNTSIKYGSQIIEQTGVNHNSVKSLVPFYDNMCKVVKKPATVTCENLVQYVNVAPVPKRKNDLVKCSEVDIQYDNRKEVKKRLDAVDFEPTLKMKRDILVTFYSILVLTVFAALAFPEMLQQT